MLNFNVTNVGDAGLFGSVTHQSCESAFCKIFEATTWTLVGSAWLFMTYLCIDSAVRHFCCEQNNADVTTIDDTPLVVVSIST